MITRPLDLASRLRPEPRNFDWLFFVNGGLIVLFFTLFGSRFVLAPGVAVLPAIAGANAGARATTHQISVVSANQIFAGDGWRDLKQLDEGLYERFVATRKGPNDPAAAEAGLRKLWSQTFRGLNELLEFCRSLEDHTKKAPATDDEPVSFDFGDLEEGGLEEGGATGLGKEEFGEGELDLGQSDIGDLLSGIDEHRDEGDVEKWIKDGLLDMGVKPDSIPDTVSYTHLTLPTNREV